MILFQAIARLDFFFLQPGSRTFQFQVQSVAEYDDFNQFHQFTIPINNKTSRNAHSFSTINNEFQSISNIIHNLLDCKNHRYLRTVFVYSLFVLGRVLRHFCNVLLQIPVVLKKNIAEITQNASQDKKTGYKTPPLILMRFECKT